MQRTLNIIGAGKVGRTLGRLWADSRKFALLDVANRSLDRAREAVAFIGAGRAVACDAAQSDPGCARFPTLRPADIWLIAVPDDRIAACCNALAESGQLSAANVVFHCSGALNAGVLDAAVRCGAAVASIHPVRSFARPEQVVSEFAGTWCGAEGEQRALAELTPAFTAIGAKLVAIDGNKKILYHAAAVFACNYLVTLQDIATQTYAAAGIAPAIALPMLEPLVRETVDNIFRLGPATALTGPIARGDTATVERQQEAVSDWNRAYGDLYRELAGRTAELAARRVGKE